MRKVLIFGASGMAGHILYDVLSKNSTLQVLGTFSSTNIPNKGVQIEISNTSAVQELLQSFSPDVVINCIGVLIKGSQAHPDKAIYANAYWPHYLCRLGKELNFKLIHISTDCVFSGNSNGGYIESSTRDARDLYGMSKALGEINDDRNLTIRTSIIGPEIKPNGEGLLHWFMKQQGNLNGYKSSIWSGVTTLELARFISWVINENLTGIFHLTNNEPISKFDLLKLINEVHKNNVEILSESDYVSNKSFLNTREGLDFQVNSYRVMIEKQFEFMKQNSLLYIQYNL